MLLTLGNAASGDNAVLGRDGPPNEAARKK